MKKIIKYLHRYQLLILVSVLLIHLTVPVYAAEKSGSCGENLKWTLSEGTLSISGHGEMTDYTDGALAPWFGIAGEIHTIELSAGMTSIGDYAFYNCENVTIINIPPNVKEIGECAFAKASSLSQLQLSEGLYIIGEGAFQECKSLKTIEFPETMTEIGEKAFFKCSSLSEVIVSDNVNVMGISVFSYCTNLKKAIIEAAITELPGWTFYGCGNLEEVTLTESIVSEGEYAFLFCDKLNGENTQVEENVDEKETEIDTVGLQPVYVPYDAETVENTELDLESVDSNPDTSNLTDAEGTTYYISSRSSKWGITVKQFTVYVALWIASAVLIVAVIMISLEQKKKSKEQYEKLVKQGEAEDYAAKEELQLQILKELLNKRK